LRDPSHRSRDLASDDPRRALRALAEVSGNGAGDLASAREIVFSAHARALYDEASEGLARHVRVDALLRRVGRQHPGALPSAEEVEAERGRDLRHQLGVELAQAQLLSAVLRDPVAGGHLVESMLTPKAEALAALEGFTVRGRLDLGVVSVERRGGVGLVTVERGDRLNAENDETTSALETAVDVVSLDPGIRACVLRGGYARHPRYEGRRVFSAGIDLSELYAGRISYLFFVVRELGFVAKMQRGVLHEGTWHEKPWIAAVDTFAIGGGTQILLVMDRVVSADDATLSLPASKEGIIPGAAPLRLPRFVGTALARRAILFEEAWPADSVPGRLICDVVVPADQLDDEVERTVEAVTAMGPTSLRANRRALREAEEPREVFRDYMAHYARDQATCLASDELAGNLERHWLERRRARA
jgi:thioesterase DpgC